MRQGYYRAFAAYLSTCGIPTLTYDYRGIGASRPRSMRSLKATVEDWGSKDCASVVNWMKTRFPEADLAVVGHSVGALVTGFVTNGRVIDRLLWFGAHTGYFGDYRKDLKPAMFLAWHTLMPAVTRAIGFFPGRLLGLGEDLPRGVALQWAGRREPDLWTPARQRGIPQPHIRQLQQRFAAVRAPALSMRFADDAFATEVASRRIASLFRNTSVNFECVTPANVGLRKGGHFAYFRTEARDALWTRAAEWLQSPAAAVNP